jgi:branched-chain amino acid transport system ATP-binding protein
MPLLSVGKMTKRFGGLTALEGVDIELQPDELKGLIGPNGSGKTTLFNVINGLYRPDQGEILFRGRNITGMPMHSVARQGIGRTFQHVQLCYDMSVLDNVILGAHIARNGGNVRSQARRWSLSRERDLQKRALDSLEFVGLDVREDTLARNLSYGHQRLIEIARALVGSPALLLLDEPAAGLNLAEQHSLMGLVRRIQETGIAVLLVEHNMRVVMGCCRTIAVLNYGRKIAEGSPQEIQTDQEVIAAYLGSRAK